MFYCLCALNASQVFVVFMILPLSLQLLQEDLEMEQVRVNSLTHMVVVVDENNGDSATAALEDKLQVNIVI